MSDDLSRGRPMDGFGKGLSPLVKVSQLGWSESEICGYLLPADNEAFWKWDDSLEAITWRSGESIAFHQEIYAVLDRLQAHGLPSMSSLVLVLAACRKNWAEPGGGKSRLAEFLESGEENPMPEKSFNDWIRPLLNGLERVNASFIERPILDRKLTILETLFEESDHSLNQEKAAEVVKALREGNLAESMRRGPPPAAARTRALGKGLAALLKTNRSGEASDFSETIKELLKVLPLLESNSPSLREKTGIDSLPEPAESVTTDLPNSIAARALIRDLRDDSNEELAGIARAARDLMGVLAIPRGVSDPDEMPLGGFSDIANKGNLDRLLLSELAQDDEILSVRVALNEALYLRRESPPEEPPHERRIFIDTGIRMWGLPRAYAHSAALALVAMIEKDDTASIFSVDHETLGPLKLTSREGLTNALGHLSVAPHPGEAITRFLKGADAEVPSEQIIITHPRVLRDPEFRRALRDAARDHPLLLISIDGDGDLTMIARTTAGDRELKHIDLGRELASKATPRHAEDKTKLPFALQLETFPLLIARPLHETMSWEVEGTFYTLTREGLLLHFSQKDRGATMIADSIPLDGGSVIANHSSADQTLMIFIGKREGPSTVVTIDTFSGMCDQAGITLGGAVDFASGVGLDIYVACGRTLHLIRRNQSFRATQIIFQHEIEGLSGYFARYADEWHSICEDRKEEKLKLESIERTAKGEPKIVLPFEGLKQSLTLVLLEDGTIRSLQGDWDSKLVEPPRPGKVIGEPMLLPDHFLQYKFRENDGSVHCLKIELNGMEVTSKPDSTDFQKLKSPVFEKFQRAIPSVRKKFSEIHVCSIGVTLRYAEVAIVFKNGTHFQLEPRSELVLDREEWISFEAMDSPATGFSLQIARFPEGSEAFLDSRGMLHLRSADANLPEITFVLKDNGMLSGWLSSGDYFGHPYFCGDHDLTPASEVHAQLQLFLDHIVSFS